MTSRFAILSLIVLVAAPQLSTQSRFDAEVARVRAQIGASVPADQQSALVQRLDRADAAMKANRTYQAAYLFEAAFEGLGPIPAARLPARREPRRRRKRTEDRAGRVEQERASKQRSERVARQVGGGKERQLRRSLRRWATGTALARRQPRQRDKIGRRAY